MKIFNVKSDDPTVTISRKIASNRKRTERANNESNISEGVVIPSDIIGKPVEPHKNVTVVDGDNLKAVDLTQSVTIGVSETTQKTVKTDTNIPSHTDNMGSFSSEGKDSKTTKATEVESCQAPDNIIQTSAREMTGFGIAMDELKSELRARGVRLQTSNVMLELALQDKSDELVKMVSSAVYASENKYGEGAITREELNTTLESMVAIEKDIILTRKQCKQRGLNIQALNILTQLMRQNPGDCGEKVINTIFGYALSCNIPLSGISSITQQYTEENQSVLPEIERQEIDNKNSYIQKIAIDVFIGIILTVALIALLV